MALVARALPHFGEEPPLAGSGGSGAVFFAGCGLQCVFCQNSQISQPPDGDFAAAGVQELSAEELAGLFSLLQQSGCHNLNLVTGASHVPAVLAALGLAAQSGFSLPVVYNSGGYESSECLELLDSVVDIYLPDMKFGREAAAAGLAEGPDYVSVNRRCVKEMFRQVGLLETGPDGLARRGLIVRHLVLPGDLSGTREVLEFLAREVSVEVHLSLMAQYYPTHRVRDLPPLSRPLTEAEYEKALELLAEYGFENGWVQALQSGDNYRPDFSQPNPFGPSPPEPETAV